MQEANNRSHNTVVIIITVSCIGCIIESLTQHWEFWVPPIIAMGVILMWFTHINSYRDAYFRENFYLIFSLAVMFFHGMHRTSFFDVFIIYALILAAAAHLKRISFMRLSVLEYYMIMVMQTIWAVSTHSISFDELTISRFILHMVAGVCLYQLLIGAARNGIRNLDRIREYEEKKQEDRKEQEDFLVNISHELRTPVNVINGLTSIILKKEDRDDIRSIREAGYRLSSQIEDISDYTEIIRGDVILEEDKYMIVSVVNDVLSGYEPEYNKKHLELVVDLDPTVPNMLKGDVKKIRKIITHILDNAIKFTRKGGVLLKITCIKRDYGVNLIIEMTDTGIGMSRQEIDSLTRGMFQANKVRTRSTGGIGLGLSIVYGFARKMNGFVSIESKKRRGTTVRVSIAQEVVDPTPCLVVKSDRFINVIFHSIPERYKFSRIRDFQKEMALNMAAGLRVNLYSATSISELKRLMEKGDITHIFMGTDEYEKAPDYFNDISKTGVQVAVATPEGYRDISDRGIIMLQKPLYSYPIAKVLNGVTDRVELTLAEEETHLDLSRIRALVVDDEPMNLIVATGLFKEYNMSIDTALSGREAIFKYASNVYDLVFMDHMMPEMDGVEAMKHIRDVAVRKNRPVRIVALTANAISGAREMFLSEGFDGFIPKPINILDFERTMKSIFPEGSDSFGR
ncbi:MAG: response regulator [Lachnospiraceae bacterium]|nr:response regulator [Lachnospiraceae bacterium]